MMRLLLTLALTYCLCPGVRAQPTQSAAQLTNIPRPEHPKPQFERQQWLNLNGTWDFAIDQGNSGKERGWQDKPEMLDREILVPFPPESKLSGIEFTDFMDAVWYHRNFELPVNWSDDRVFLHFGGVDYAATVWVNGEEIGTHHGGSVSFAMEITGALNGGGNSIVVLAEDDIRSGVQPNGKQSITYANDGCCNYTRVTGIWQTVWLEARPESHLESARLIADLDNSRFTVQPVFDRLARDQQFRVTVTDGNGQRVLQKTEPASNHQVMTLDLDTPRTWSPDDPHLYDLKLELLAADGSTIDAVSSYAGLRKTHVEGNKIYLNNEPIFLRFVLDQGFYPDGIWTAPSDAALIKDIQLSMDIGFNGARLHQKLFEERFHYHADRMGYLTWAEFPDWGAPQTYARPESMLNFLREWRESMERDWNHPSIIAWTPLNETHSPKLGLEPYERGVRDVYALTRALDPTRPVNTTSGWLHVVTDIWTVHDYTQNPNQMTERYAPLPDSSGYYLGWNWYDRAGVIKRSGYDLDYHNYPERIPFVMDEYGGTFWTAEWAKEAPRGNGRNNWGYGKNQAQVEQAIIDLTRALMDNPNVAGYVYTQLTDVQQEVNGVYTFDRRPKFDVRKLAAVFGGRAAIEE